MINNPEEMKPKYFETETEFYKYMADINFTNLHGLKMNIKTA